MNAATRARQPVARYVLGKSAAARLLSKSRKVPLNTPYNEDDHIANVCMAKWEAVVQACKQVGADSLKDEYEIIENGDWVQVVFKGRESDRVVYR